MKTELTLAIPTTADLPASSSILAGWSGGMASKTSAFAYSPSHTHWPLRSHQRRRTREAALANCSEAIRTWGQA